jgi:hypothetical protein
MLITLGLLLFVDFLAVQSMREPRRSGAFHPPQFAMTGTPGTFQLHEGESFDGVTGQVMLIIRRWDPDVVWAPVEKYLDVSIQVYPQNNSTATPVDFVRMGSQLAEVWGPSGEVATLLRAGGGRKVETLPWGYVHNSVAGLLALGFIACVGSIARDKYIMARAMKRDRQGLCVSCGYPRTAGRCPECGHDSASS